MRHAIGYALHWPERGHVPVERLDLAKVAKLTFRAPDETRYPALRLAREVMAAGGLSGAVFNAAKERALDGFIAGEIGFLDMAAVVEEVLTELTGAGHIAAEFSLDNVVAADHLAREAAARTIAARRQA
jgi:1-deoxy-D-xylulose-5-phosphate reductoisomerase